MAPHPSLRAPDAAPHGATVSMPRTSGSLFKPHQYRLWCGGSACKNLRLGRLSVD